MSDLKIKAATGKVAFYLLPLRFLIGVCRVFFYGSRKYKIGNWYAADDTEEIANRYVGGFLRHLAETQQPNGTYDLSSIGALDDESGLPHIDHAICGLIMLRGLAVKHGGMMLDPGIGNDPPRIEPHAVTPTRRTFTPHGICVRLDCAEARRCVKPGHCEANATDPEEK